MYSYAAIVDKGPVFEVNDDRVLIGNTIIKEGEFEGKIQDNYIFLAVADGVGGLQLGYEAAELTLKTVSELFQPNMDRVSIRNYIEEANQKVIFRQKEIGRRDGLRTTLAALYIDEKRVYVANAGDSRVYCFRNGKLQQLSKDHSVVQNLIDVAEITEEESYTHPKRNVITKCIGEEDRVIARIIDGSEELCIGDVFLLCTDGISDCLRINKIEDILINRNERSLIEICRDIFQNAINNGSKDNISICLVRKER